MNIILFGPPGSGKGTQADNITKKYNLFKVSTGDLLRDEIKKNTALGKIVKPLVEKGHFASDDIINGLIIKILSDKKFYNRLIFDGYPRNLVQAKNLHSLIDQYKQKISCVLNLNVKKETIIKRILGRQVCNKCGLIFNEFFKPSTSNNHSCDSKYLVKRSDDNEKTIDNRFKTYLDKTLPILEFYKNQKLLYEINGEAEIDIIYKEIQAIINTLEA